MSRARRIWQFARSLSTLWSWLTLRRLSQTFFLALFVADSLIFLKTDPFIALVNALATHSLYRGLLWSLAVLIPTFFLGRFFCGWICPLGTLNHLAGNLRSGWKLGRRRIASNRYKKWQSFKYYLLFALLAAAFLSSALAGIFDPIALAGRSFHLAFRQALPLAVILLLILALNLRITRFWCRALCPLGALLGLASRWSILGLEKHSTQCTDCNRCLLHCQGGDDPIPGVPWRKSECHLCLNCISDCPEAGIRFRFFPQNPTTLHTADLQRRQLLTGLAAGAVSVPLLRAGTGLHEPDDRLIRPPAALAETQFLARCIRCGECMKVCPTNALHPAFSQAGWEGPWTPLLVPRVGYCEPGCARCGDVCPTGAIWQFTAQQKGWAGAATRPIRLGTAFYDRGRCLPWAMATECVVCQEWCPISPKAIYLRPAEITDADGNAKRIDQPYINPQACVGCGACEYACPVHNPPAVYVTSVGESRSKTNQFLLQHTSKPAAWLPDTGDVAGWSKTGETREFAAADLWKYVDGDAGRYLKAGVRHTLTAMYRYRNSIEAVIDIHQMRSPEGAKSIFESEPSAGSHPVSMGDAARSWGQSLTVRKGPFFVRLVAYQDTPQTEPALVALGQAVAERLAS